MLHITDQAAAHLHEITDQDGNTSGIRVSVMGSTGFGLTPDASRETDHVTLCGEVELLIDKQLLAYCRNITIDFRECNPDGCSSRSGRGFVIKAENPIAG